MFAVFQETWTFLTITAPLGVEELLLCQLDNCI